MAKASSIYVCQSCGATASRWAGRCDNCGAWNSLVEEAAAAPLPGGVRPRAGKGRRVELVGLKGASPVPARLRSGIQELDRVAGGGLVPGSAVLIGGDPGIGKSTLILQALALLARRGEKVVYVSGEEAVDQVRLRAERLGLSDAAVLLAAETNLDDVLTTLGDAPSPSVIAVDSVQTIWSPQIDAAPGTVSQLRAGTEALVRFAKSRGTTVLLVGHVTKEGQIAGPKLIEHMVDAVFYFEGDRGHHFRILRAVKNRFGPTDEIGVFEMSDGGLAEVENPSGLFLGDRSAATPGAAVFAGMEGTRPLLVEVQTLVSPSTLGTPRRAVVGWDGSRLAMILAVLDTHCGVGLGGYDVYLNVAGGLRIREPAADLAVAAALVSSLLGAALPADSVLFGEVALSGALRPVAQGEARLKEAAKLGFKTAVVPEAAKSEWKRNPPLALHAPPDLRSLVRWVQSFGPATGRPREAGPAPARSIAGA
ncbi:DNA repair protein RadA [Rhodoligotrophos defluvii]|uniref:DNA repair protein RadA n=1 Tax=Rhodoligotrophos defluvii TaxID=2561934 RepID=UPI0010C97089|nr:DNA repair protein RadA [Rhodoligotrophos defluvii]